MQAGVDYCLIAAHMQKDAKAMHADKDCPGCTMTGKHEQKQNGCCDDSACIIKCSTVGLTASTIPTKIEIPDFTAVAVKFPMADGVLPASLLQTQDRPPKHLS